MNRQHKEIRTLLSVMAPNRATDYIKAFNLPTDEETCLILRDVQKKSVIQIADLTGLSEATVKSKRQMAFAHIADEINTTA